MGKIEWTIEDINPESNIPETMHNPDEDSLSTQKKARFKQDTEFRKHFSIWVMIIVPVWLVLTLVVLVLTGLEITIYSEGVLVALLATTTANVLGLAFIVLRGMFPEGNIKDGKNE